MNKEEKRREEEMSREAREEKIGEKRKEITLPENPT